MRLSSKITIVTGAGSGIGAGIAKRFAQEGAKVIVADINAAAGAPGYGRHDCELVDLRRGDGVEQDRADAGGRGVRRGGTAADRGEHCGAERVIGSREESFVWLTRRREGSITMFRIENQ